MPRRHAPRLMWRDQKVRGGRIRKCRSTAMDLQVGTHCACKTAPHSGVAVHSRAARYGVLPRAPPGLWVQPEVAAAP